MVGLAALVDVSFGQGDAPAILKGLNQADKSIGATIKTPNGQVTKLSSSMALIETGNNNILENPNFEHSVYDTSWVIGSGSSSKVDVNIDSTKVFSGLNALKMTMAASTLGVFNVSPTGNQAYKDGVQGLVSVRIKTTVSGIRVCQRKGIAITTNCVNVIPDGKWNLYKVPSILGEFFNGVEITSSPTAVTGDVYIDDAFVGATDLTQNISACQTPDCTTEFSARISSAGVISAENVDWVNGNCTVASTSQYTCTFNSSIFTVAPNCTLEDNDNGNFTQSFISSPTSTGFTSRTLNGSTGVNAAASHTIICQRSGSDYATAKQLSNGNTYSSTNADTDWSSCGLTGSAFTGFGSSVPTPSLQCKRQGGDLLIKGTFTAGTTPTAVEARMALPTWNGTQLVSANSSIIPSLQLAGTNIVNIAGVTFFGEYALIEPSVSYLTFSVQTSTLNGLTKATGAAISSTGSNLSINARIPIEGWQNSNIIIGQFNGLESCSSTLECTDTFSATITNTGAVVAGSENVDFITGNCSKGGTGITNCTINTGVFSVVPNLVATIDDGAGGCREARSVETNTNTSFRIDTFTSAGVAADCRFRVVLQKSAADYVGKTARAVSSDQNLRTPGVTNSVVYSAYIGAAGTVASEIGNLINGNCTVASTNVFTCTFTSGIFASDPVCNLTVLGASGASRSAYIVTSPTTSGLTYLTYNTSGPTAVALNVQLTCHGVSP